MKQTLTTAIALCALLSTSCAFAQRLLSRRLPSGTRSVEQPPKGLPKETYEKVPEEHRRFVKDTIENKAQKAADAEVVEKFNIIILSRRDRDVKTWTNNCGKSVFILDGFIAKFSADGRLVQVGRRDTFEEFKWYDNRYNELMLAYWNDPEIVAEAVSNSVKSIERDGRSSNSLRVLQPQRLPLRNKFHQLEEQIPFEEAITLAKNGKGKGFYQLALKYALGDEVTMNQALAYQMLAKASQANYANAVLIEGLCDERDSLGSFRSEEIDMMIQKYCCNGYNASIFRAKRTDLYDQARSLTNEVAFARVMGKYERARELGALSATNQIAALNKRLEDFKKKEAALKETANRKEENDRRVKEMLEVFKIKEGLLEISKRIREDASSAHPRQLPHLPEIAPPPSARQQ